MSRIVSVKWIINRDVALCASLNRISCSRAGRKFFVFVSELGDGGVWYALIVALPLLYGESGLVTAMNMVKVGIANLVLYKIIKSLTTRARPCAVNANIILGTEPIDQYSFPSGHALHAVAFSMIATSRHPELAGILIPLTWLIALSRVILGLHYPTDVIAGGVIGAYVAFTLAIP